MWGIENKLKIFVNFHDLTRHSRSYKLDKNYSIRRQVFFHFFFRSLSSKSPSLHITHDLSSSCRLQLRPLNIHVVFGIVHTLIIHLIFCFRLIIPPRRSTTTMIFHLFVCVSLSSGDSSMLLISALISEKYKRDGKREKLTNDIMNISSTIISKSCVACHEERREHGTNAKMSSESFHCGFVKCLCDHESLNSQLDARAFMCSLSLSSHSSVFPPSLAGCCDFVAHWHFSENFNLQIIWYADLTSLASLMVCWAWVLLLFCSDLDVSDFRMNECDIAIMMMRQNSSPRSTESPEMFIEFSSMIVSLIPDTLTLLQF